MSEPNAWIGVAGTAIGAVVGAPGQSIAVIVKNVWDERQERTKDRKARREARHAAWGRVLRIATEIEAPGSVNDFIAALGRAKEFLLDNPDWLSTAECREFISEFGNTASLERLKSLPEEVRKNEVERIRKAAGVALLKPTDEDC